MRKVFGGILLGAGILAGGASGLCAIGMVISLNDHPDPLARNISQGVLTISLIVLVFSLGLGFLGRHLLKKGGSDE